MICWVAKSLLLMFLMRDFRVDSVTCHQTEYEIEGECCPMCPPGTRVKTHCTEFKSTSCQKCSDGTYMDLQNGLRSCSLCSTCGSGAGLKVKRGCEITADTVCEPMEGFYCTDLKSGSCAAAQKHRSCEPGQFISRMGTASTDTECSECSSGSFSDGTMLSCQLHTQCDKENLELIKAGTASTDAECGGKSSNNIGVVIGVLVVFLVAATIGGGVGFWIYHKNTKPNSCTIQQQGGKAGEAEEEVAFNMPVVYQDQRTPKRFTLQPVIHTHKLMVSSLTEVSLLCISVTRSSDHQQARQMNCPAQGHDDRGRWSQNRTSTPPAAEQSPPTVNQ